MTALQTSRRECIIIVRPSTCRDSYFEGQKTYEVKNFRTKSLKLFCNSRVAEPGPSSGCPKWRAA